MSETASTAKPQIPKTPDSPPSLTQSDSNFSGSPPQPATPPARNRTRYPDLGRVPLHRRGTSGTYERLEDLLREAGYKETRVFTPETERSDKPKPENGNRNSIAGTVVGFLTGLIPTSSRQTSGLQQSVSREDFSPPASPLAGRHKQQTPSISSVEGLGPTPKGKTSIPSSPLLPRLPPSPLVPPPTSPNPSQPLFHPRPSRASAYLRQMASHPNLQRPRSTPAYNQRESMILNESDEDFLYSGRGNGEGEEEEPPPLPRTWLETVARAVLFGGAGAYIGGPAAQKPEPQPASDSRSPPGITPAVRQARSVIAKSHEHAKQHSQNAHASSSSKKWSSNHRNNLGLHRTRSGLSDRTNRSRDLALTSASTFATSTSGFSAFSTKSLHPPQLLSRVESSRSGNTLGEVSKTRVVCRSAPASRATSMSRRTSNDREENHRARSRASGKEKERREAKRGRKGKMQRAYSAGDGRGVPTLARTKIEGDDLWKANGRPTRVITDPRGPRYHRGTLSDSPDSSPSDESSSSEDEGELDLARMLVPPKRQNSIKSLRKHLAAEGTASASLLAITQRTTADGYGSGNSRTFRQWLADRQSPSDDWEDEIHGTSGGWGWPSGRRPPNRRGGSHEDLDDEASFLEFLSEDRKPSHRLGTGRSTTSKVRTPLPTFQETP